MLGDSDKLDLRLGMLSCAPLAKLTAIDSRLIQDYTFSQERVCASAVAKQLRVPQELVLTAGATGALDALLQPINSRSALWLPDPTYQGYIPYASRFATVVGYDPYRPGLDGVAEGDSVVLNYPHNPTGANMSTHDLMHMCSELGALSASTIVDAVYRPYDDPIWSTSMPRHVCLVGSLSKGTGATSLRIGFVVAAGSNDPSILDRIHQSVVQSSLGLSGLSLHAVARIAPYMCAINKKLQCLVDIQRIKLLSILQDCEWFEAESGMAPYILCKSLSAKPSNVVAEDVGLVISQVRRFDGSETDWVRIPIGIPEDRFEILTDKVRGMCLQTAEEG